MVKNRDNKLNKLKTYNLIKNKNIKKPSYQCTLYQSWTFFLSKLSFLVIGKIIIKLFLTLKTTIIKNRIRSIKQIFCDF